MNIKDKTTYATLAEELAYINSHVLPLPGINKKKYRDTLIRQMIDSLRRVEFVHIVKSRKISQERCDPRNIIFDPIRAAILKLNEGDIDEAAWLVFLATHFGKHKMHGWKMVRDVYGGLNNNTWTWHQINNNFSYFQSWFNLNCKSIQRAFGNHRKYESIQPSAQRNLNRVISSYLNFVGTNSSHLELFSAVSRISSCDPEKMFHELYNNSLREILSFGRAACFDYLTMLSKIGIINIVPEFAYLNGATGPLTGAKLLLKGTKTGKVMANDLEESLNTINSRLTIGIMGMQVLEDSLCNWQKNPSFYVRFSG